MDEEIQKFISIFDPNKRIDFTKVLTNDITRFGICGSLDVQKYGSKFGCCVCVGYCKKVSCVGTGTFKTS